MSAAEGSYEYYYENSYYDEYADAWYVEYWPAGPGLTSFTFTVSLSAASAERVTVDFATSNGTAIHMAPVGEPLFLPNDAAIDYYENAGQLTFAPGERTKTITIWVVADFTPEPDETFFVNLSGATGAIIADGRGIGTILGDDGWTPPPPNPWTCPSGNCGW